MSIKKSYTVGIMDERKINKINTTISKYADITMKSSSHMYFDKQPINANEVYQDVTFFQMHSDDEDSFDMKLNQLINDLNEISTDYIMMDEETKILIVTIDYGGYIKVKFDKVNYLEPGTYDRLDEIKTLKIDIGYCKGFKPKFRPLCGDLSDVLVNPEIIYLVSDSSENIEKFRDLVSHKILEINPDFKLEFGHIDPQNF